MHKVNIIKHLQVSIHAPREGSDNSTNVGQAMQAMFQSTLPVRGATLIIHIAQNFSNCSFNPRSP